MPLTRSCHQAHKRWGFSTQTHSHTHTLTHLCQLLGLHPCDGRGGGQHDRMQPLLRRKGRRFGFDKQATDKADQSKREGERVSERVHLPAKQTKKREKQSKQEYTRRTDLAG